MTRDGWTSIFPWGLALLLIALSPCARAEAAEPDAAAACAAIAATDYADIADAPTRVSQASLADGAAQRACVVRGYVAPQVGFALFLPGGWNGKFLVVGVGGAAGTVVDDLCQPYVRRGYACMTSDFGHRGGWADGLWAQGDPAAQADLAHRAAHVLALAGRRITRDHYGKAPGRAYYIGCSGAGTIGLTAAQRYPYDYDGMLIGDPAVLVSDWAMQIEWANRRLRTADGTPLFSQPSLALLNKGALTACDAEDGLRDGVISNPIGCRFDPAVLQCRAGARASCLTAAQVGAAAAIYRGPSLAEGGFAPGPLAWPGSELEWNAFYDMRAYVADQVRYGVFGNAPGEISGDYLADTRRFGLGIFRDASNPDLRRFEAKGSKILAYLGAANGVGVSSGTLDYYRLVERISGGPAKSRGFFRLFVVPGMNHCGGGVGAWRTDMLPALESWVERGAAPDRLVASHLAEDEPRAASDAAQFFRSLYPYPAYPRYDGKGDPRSAASFIPEIRAVRRLAERPPSFLPWTGTVACARLLAPVAGRRGVFASPATASVRRVVIGPARRPRF